MSSENFWELFTETGDITYYLLYSAPESRGDMAVQNERPRPEPSQ